MRRVTTSDSNQRWVGIHRTGWGYALDKKANLLNSDLVVLVSIALVGALLSISKPICC
jgi:hypothetical protein